MTRKKQPQVGRPPKVGPLANIRMVLYCTPEEQEKIITAANDAGMTVSAWARRMLMLAAHAKRS